LKGDRIESPAEAPNIICIMVDDVSAIEFNFYNGPGINTPEIDKMAKDGVGIATAYSQPLCGPTRATLLTGKYAHKNGHYSNGVSPKTSIHTTHYTLGKAMRDAGYSTAWFGKQHIDRFMNPSDFGFDYYLVAKYWEGYDGPDQGRERPVRTGMYGAKWFWHPGLVANGTGIPTTPDDFGPKIELDSLLSFISSDKGKPFFVYWPTNLPHHEFDPETQTWVRPEIPEFDENGKWTGNRIAASMQSNLEFIDYAIGKILKKLEENDELDNTILFFMGDNGTAGYGKGKPESEIALHVPFLVYGPGLLKPKGMSDVLVDFTDVLPTFIDLAGFSTEQTADMDGHSFAPYLRGEPFTPRQWISAQLDAARWIRTREWLLDGKGQLWHCGSESDERKFNNLSNSSLEEHLLKKKELQDLMDANIPLWDGVRVK
ncbi:MAG: sulfatase-like hydrolase/transferase, partial [Bacteroidales bacterium]|nr:sulfatase-like hydrolase/transferase [Bacteroidales bacterium]